MKKLLLLLALYFAASSAIDKAHAQVYQVYLSYISDNVNTNCSVPARRSIHVVGNAWGALANEQVAVHANFGDGTDTTVIFRVNSAETFIGWMYHNYQSTGTYAVEMVASISGLTDTTYLDTVTLDNTCAALSGKLYIDNNADCIYNTGDDAMPFTMVKIKDTLTGTISYAMSDADGYYAAGLPPGASYTIQPAFYTGNLVPSCPASGQATVTISTNGSVVRDFAYTCNTGGPVDLSVAAFATCFRPGYTRPLEIWAGNTHTCANTPAVVTLTLDTLLRYDHSSWWSILPTAISGNMVSWTLPSISGLDDFFSEVHLLCDSTATLGDTACIMVAVTTTANDTNTLNNSYSLCIPISNSFDPNDKNVFPKGEGAAGNIPGGTALNYLVNFQNTGTDVAYNVVVRDTLDADLDLSTLKVIQASHPVQASIQGRILSFRFEQINLPDSNADEPGSHGFVTYSIKPKTGLQAGTQLRNTAYIYFDFNPPIVTNTVLNTISMPTGVSEVTTGGLAASVHPNPANEAIIIETPGSSGFTAVLTDITGRIVRTLETSSGRLSVDVRSVPSGVYLLRIVDDRMQQKTLKICIAH